MSCFLITFDVTSIETRRGWRIEFARSTALAGTVLEHVWMVNTLLTGLEIRNSLRSISGPADKIIVALLAGWAIWHGFEGDAEAWLTANL
jgi:hypothetical protein